MWISLEDFECWCIQDTETGKFMKRDNGKSGWSTAGAAKLAWNAEMYHHFWKYPDEKSSFNDQHRYVALKMGAPALVEIKNEVYI
jgi:hypothetical protein